MKHTLYYLLITFFLFSYHVFSQEEQISVQLPQVFPVSPEAASLGKYGDIPINLATGKINYTVPLYTIKVGDFEWPIYLSYNYSGLLVEQDPGHTGLGWDLMATGRITREILGVPDELDVSNFKASTVVPYLTGAYDNWSYEDYENKRFEIYDRIANLNEDGQYDNYRISAGDVNGTFKINENNEAVFLVHRNYVADKNFIIDEKGIKYYFNEIEMAEYNITYGPDTAPSEVPSSYLLTRIELPNNAGEILFEYKPFDPSNDVYFKTVWSDTEISGLENKIVLDKIQTAVYTRLLKRIIFPNGQVDFTTVPYLQQYSNLHGAYSKKSFALKDMTVTSLDKQIVKYDFIYNNESQSNKMLKEITRSNNNSTETYYRFDYYNESSISSNIPYSAQDNWGYYNGKSASSLIQATREIDTITTKYGALKKITYPTGGTTSVNYEQNKIYAEDSGTPVNCSYTHNFSRTFRLDAQNAMEYKYLDTTIDVGHSQIVKVIITAAVKKGTTSNALGNEAFISVTANNASEYCGFSRIHDFSLNADAEECSNYSSSELCWGDLIMTKEIVGYAEDGIINISGYVMELANKEAYIEYQIFSENKKFSGGNKNVGGIRVSGTTDCDGLGKCETTNYYYSYASGTFSRSSGVYLGGTPQFEYTTYHENEPKSGGGTVSGERTYRSVRSKNSFNSYQGSPLLYQWVRIIEGDGANGYIRNQYSTGLGNINPGFPFLEATNYDWQKGKLLTSDIYKKSGDNNVLIKKISKKYTSFYPYGVGLNSSKIAFGMDAGRIKWRHWGTGIYEGEPNDYKEDYNYYYPKEYKLIKSTVEEFDNQNLKHMTTTDYLYDQQYLDVNEISTVSSNGDFLKTKFYYPYNLGLSTLVNQNRISLPVRTVKYNDINEDYIAQTGELLQTIQNVYKNWGNGIYLPEFVNTSKGSVTPESRIRYYMYDLSGNPLEVSQEKGAHSVYLWGYDKQHPIAKIENATSLEVKNALTTLKGSTVSTLNTIDERDIGIINGLRGVLSKSLITTYTYAPLIGVTSITDPKGDKITYHYDSFNRLQYVKDVDGKLLKENKYNYKTN